MAMMRQATGRAGLAASGTGVAARLRMAQDNHHPASLGPPPASPSPSRISAQSVLRAYGGMAPLYDLMFGAVLQPGRRALAEAVCRLDPARLLEVGVGTGLALSLYPPSTKVVGVDLSPQMLARARKRAVELPGRDIELRLMNAERMDFPDASFDCVTLPYVLSVTPSPARLVAEARRVCKPDGCILVLNHFSGSRFWWVTERALRSVADRVGFRSDFRYEDHVLVHDWEVLSLRSVNLFGLSRLVEIRNRCG
jgi:phosphatidylethanolamine/phosphatidyl-N-methylethanolamine N-methyltransferase